MEGEAGGDEGRVRRVDDRGGHADDGPSDAHADDAAAGDEDALQAGNRRAVKATIVDTKESQRAARHARGGRRQPRILGVDGVA